MTTLTATEFDAVTETFLRQLTEKFETASCNDLYPDEYPQSVCDKFEHDSEVFDEWKRMLKDRLDNPDAV